MKILLIGFLSFFAWSSVSTYYYVCKIKHFCNDRETIQVDAIIMEPVFFGDSVITPGIQKMADAIFPEGLRNATPEDEARIRQYLTGAESNKLAIIK